MSIGTPGSRSGALPESDGLEPRLLYQGFTYWVFRHRVSADTKLEY